MPPWAFHLVYGFGRLPPFLNVTANPNPVEVGAELTIAALAAGADVPLTVNITGVPPGCESGNQAVIECQPTEVGNYTVRASVTDGLGRTATGWAEVRVIPHARVEIEESSESTDVGHPVEFQVAVTGGEPPYLYGYGGLPSGCETANTAELNCTPEASGNYAVSGAVIDSSGVITTAMVNLTVYPSPSVTVRSSRRALDVGQSVSLEVTVTGGKGPYEWKYEGLPVGCNSTNASTINCQPGAPGRYAVEVEATDSFGEVAVATAVWVVWPALMVQVGGGGLVRSAVGQVVDLPLKIEGGLGPYQVEVMGLRGGSVSGGNLSWTAVGPGNYTATIRVVDANGDVATASTNIMVVEPGSSGGRGLSEYVIGGGIFGGSMAAVAVVLAWWRKRQRR